MTVSLWTIPPGQYNLAQSSGEYYPALLYGYSVYTTFKIPASQELILSHLNRLESDAKQMGILFGWEAEKLASSIQIFLNKASVLRLALVPLVKDFPCIINGEADKSILLVSSRPIPDKNPSDFINVLLIPYDRPVAMVKHGSMGGDLYWRRIAVQHGYDDVIWVNGVGHLSEASTANIFAVSEQSLTTPDPQQDGCLPGVTRQRLIEYSLQNNFSILVSPISLDSLASLDGLFLTNAVSGVRKVKSATLIQNIGLSPDRIKSEEKLEIQFPWPEVSQNWVDQIVLETGI